jgi:hypothetical protein
MYKTIVKVGTPIYCTLADMFGRMNHKSNADSKNLEIIYKKDIVVKAESSSFQWLKFA